MIKNGKRALVLGSGNSTTQHHRHLWPFSLTHPEESLGKTFAENFEEVWTVDFDAASKPMILWDLEKMPWPIPPVYFDAVFAYEVLEHLGQVGNFKSFFELWQQIWHTLKPGGLVCATTPWWQSIWAWSDPGHRMVYSPGLLVFLSQAQYKKQVGVTAMTDYRAFWPKPFSFELKGKYEMLVTPEDPSPLSASFSFVLEKVVAT